MSLYPTKTRLALLQAVADGAVKRLFPLLPASAHDEWDDITRTPRRVTVTAKVGDLEREGRVRLGDKEYDHYKSPRVWVITPAGQKILDDATGGSLTAVTS